MTDIIDRTLKFVRTYLYQNCPNEYYKNTYSKSESLCWKHIPEWLIRDNPEFHRKSVLDVGAAYGTLSLFMYCLNRNSAVYAIDFMADYWTEGLGTRWGIQHKICNIETEYIPWVGKQFDVIILTEVMEHFNFHPVATLNKLARALAPGGKIYLSTPDAKQWGHLVPEVSSWRGMTPNWVDLPQANSDTPIVDKHVYQYTLEELVDVLCFTDLEMVQFAYAPGLVHRHINAVLQAK